MFNKKFILALGSALILGIILALVGNIFINNIRKTQDSIITHNLSSIKIALKLNIHFLRARRAEKNLLLYKDMDYKGQVESSILEAKNNFLKLKALVINNQEIELIAPLEHNLKSYDKLFQDLTIALNANLSNPEDISKISEQIKIVNDALADHVEYVIGMHSNQIEQKQTSLNTYFTVLKNTLTIMLPIIIIFGYFIGHLIFLYDVA